MPDIVVSEFMDQAAVDDLNRDFDVHYDPDLADRPEELIRLVAAARALIVRNRTQVRGGLLEAANSLEVVGRLGVGLDNIDLEACGARNIEVCPASGANDDSVAEYVIAMTMVLLRGAFQTRDAVIAGEWPRQASIGREAAGKQMGLIGYGGIARNVAVRARAMGMRTAAFDPFLPPDHPVWWDCQKCELNDLLASSDVISLHVPLNDETRNLLDAEAIAGLKKGAVVINTARGGVIDEPALAEALRMGALGGAALDVFAVEPLTAQAGSQFAGVPNLFLTPHIAGVTEEGNVRVSAVTADNVRKVLEKRR
ncbi:hydroxyacid dehydrogenase [Denitrobaculum tricleocarpae]|uniref:Hydroxyacid dehydrogenase n=1 Tax=Denitrobaculum tricleocarpae TaxID=2591009 RepID=A0A545TXC3_9PROT|nr:hydroxyacid dehydrogenase [Denitrobaculum tricleocarpae]TQV81869.1 hydroxyacid dehydrogenase [Denitrobaculum tricleocarpae]